MTHQSTRTLITVSDIFSKYTMLSDSVCKVGYFAQKETYRGRAKMRDGAGGTVGYRWNWVSGYCTGCVLHVSVFRRSTLNLTIVQGINVLIFNLY